MRVMSQDRRTRLDVYADILKAIGEESRKTHIVYEANLNFKRCRRYLDNLRNNGLIKVQSKSPLTWTITQKGKNFLKKYEEIREMLPR